MVANDASQQTIYLFLPRTRYSSRRDNYTVRQTIARRSRKSTLPYKGRECGRRSHISAFAILSLKLAQCRVMNAQQYACARVPVVVFWTCICLLSQGYLTPKSVGRRFNYTQPPELEPRNQEANFPLEKHLKTSLSTISSPPFLLYGPHTWTPAVAPAAPFGMTTTTFLVNKLTSFRFVLPDHKQAINHGSPRRGIKTPRMQRGTQV